MSEGYHLSTFIDVSKVIGNTLVDLTKDVIDLLKKEQEEEAQPKEERE